MPFFSATITFSIMFDMLIKMSVVVCETVINPPCEISRFSYISTCAKDLVHFSDSRTINCLIFPYLFELLSRNEQLDDDDRIVLPYLREWKTILSFSQTRNSVATLGIYFQKKGLVKQNFFFYSPNKNNFYIGILKPSGK